MNGFIYHIISVGIDVMIAPDVRGIFHIDRIGFLINRVVILVLFMDIVLYLIVNVFL